MSVEVMGVALPPVLEATGIISLGESVCGESKDIFFKACHKTIVFVLFMLLNVMCFQ